MVATQLPHRCIANLPPILAGQRRCWQGTLSWELVGGPNRRRRHGRQPLACGCDGCAVTIAQRAALQQWGAVRLAQVGRAKTQQRSVQWMCWGRSVMGSPAACFAATPATRRGGRHRRRLSERTPATHLFSSCPHGSAPLRVFQIGRPWHAVRYAPPTSSSSCTDQLHPRIIHFCFCTHICREPRVATGPVFAPYRGPGVGSRRLLVWRQFKSGR